MAYDIWLENRTPFAAETHVQIDQQGQELLLVILSATFIAPDGADLTLAEQQTPIRFSDEMVGDPAFSSTMFEADIALQKPFVDVLIFGSAHTPNGQMVQQVTVAVKVADINKVLNVSGDRVWLGKRPSDAEPFHTMPITYERAYGGCGTENHVDMRNPVGIGYRGSRSADSCITTEIANIEYPNELIRKPSDHPSPAGFGVVGRGWLPRLNYAGTYDQEWIDTCWPLMPTDFDPRHNQAAPEDQQSHIIKGGELVELFNLTENAYWQFRLPSIEAPMLFRYDDRIETTKVRLDTVLIESNLFKVTVKARATIKTVRNAPRLREIIIGHVLPGWLIARQKGKDYINLKGNNGTERERPTYLL